MMGILQPDRLHFKLNVCVGSAFPQGKLAFFVALLPILDFRFWIDKPCLKYSDSKPL